MPRACTVCCHPARNPIETAIVARVPYRDIAKQHGLTSSGVWRHARSHLPATLVRATEAAQLAHADSLLDKVKGYIHDAENIMAGANTKDDKRLALQALDRAMSGVTLLAKLSGDLDDRGHVNVLISSPEWMQVQDAILSALAPFPDASAAVKAALRPTAEGAP
jgi:hypothetical protein